MYVSFEWDVRSVSSSAPLSSFDSSEELIQAYGNVDIETRRAREGQTTGQ